MSNIPPTPETHDEKLSRMLQQQKDEKPPVTYLKRGRKYTDLLNLEEALKKKSRPSASMPADSMPAACIPAGSMCAASVPDVLEDNSLEKVIQRILHARAGKECPKPGTLTVQALLKRFVVSRGRRHQLDDVNPIQRIWKTSETGLDGKWNRSEAVIAAWKAYRQELHNGTHEDLRAAIKEGVLTDVEKEAIQAQLGQPGPMESFDSILIESPRRGVCTVYALHDAGTLGFIPYKQYEIIPSLYGMPCTTDMILKMMFDQGGFRSKELKNVPADGVNRLEVST